MARKNENLTKVTIRIYKGDKEALDDFYPQFGHNKAIRELIRAHVKKLCARHNKTQESDQVTIDVSI